MPQKLFVGSLSWDSTDESLRRAFERFGELEDVVVITDRETGRSRGFGFVSFRDAEAANTAMSEMDGQELDGRTIRVNEASERPPRAGGGGGGGFRGGFDGGGGGGGGGRSSGGPRGGGRGGSGGGGGGRGGGGGGGGGGRNKRGGSDRRGGGGGGGDRW